VDRQITLQNKAFERLRQGFPHLARGVHFFFLVLEARFKTGRSTSTLELASERVGVS